MFLNEGSQPYEASIKLQRLYSWQLENSWTMFMKSDNTRIFMKTFLRRLGNFNDHFRLGLHAFLNKRTQHRHPSLSGIRTHDPSVRASEDSSCLRLRGRCDRRPLPPRLLNIHCILSDNVIYLVQKCNILPVPNKIYTGV
jgi:hypothetical protein